MSNGLRSYNSKTSSKDCRRGRS